MDDTFELETIFAQRAADGVVLITLNRPEHGNGCLLYTSDAADE